MVVPLPSAVPSAPPASPDARVPTPRPASVAASTERTDELTGIAWIVREVTHVPGVLRLHLGRLTFESTRGVVFDGTPAELGLELGRSARAGLRVTVGAERLRVQVVRPPGGVAPCRELVDQAADGAPTTTGDPGSWAFWQARLAAWRGPAARPCTRVRRAFAALAPPAPS